MKYQSLKLSVQKLKLQNRMERYQAQIHLLIKVAGMEQSWPKGKGMYTEVDRAGRAGLSIHFVTQMITL